MTPHVSPLPSTVYYSNLQNIPVIGYVSAGLPEDEDVWPVGELDMNEYLLSSEGACYLRVEGNAAEHESIYDGDILAVDRYAKPSPGKLAVIQTKNRLWLKRLGPAAPFLRLVYGVKNCKNVQKPLTPDLAVWGIVTAVVRKF